jgi:bifunctional UDP-N-acetylglucosamine pyrophosphorylase/glucosamine-1-phosphate N-acetyltransferase
MRDAGRTIGAHVATDANVTLGINDRVDLANVCALAQERINAAHMRAGVTIVDPRTAHIDVTVRIGADTVIEPGCVLRGATTIGAGATIGAFTTLIDAEIGDGATVLRSHLERARVDARATVGPFAYLRPGAVLHEGAKAGTFVEIKNSSIGAGSKVPHLSYIGDADVGENSNLGASTITANYDGRRKHRTTVGDRVRVSVDTTLVAPVTIGDDAYTGAGSVITDDVPPGALGIARERQRNVEGYAERVSRRER